MHRPGDSTSAHRHRGRPLLALLIVLALVAAACVRPPIHGGPRRPPGPVARWSTAVGTDGRVYLADEHGRARQLHGFNHKTDDPDTATDALLAAAAERGLDHMRLIIYWQHLEPQEGQFDQDYLDRIVAALDRAQRHGLLVILDMHQDVYGPKFGGGGIPEWATRDDGLPYTQHSVWLLNYLEPAVQAAFEHLYEDEDLREYQERAWLTVVERVKRHPALLGYDLLNEPFGKIRPGETLFTAAPRVEREQLTPMFQRLTDAISAVDPHHWVFFEPPNLASLGIPTSLGPVTGPKVAVYPHMYDPAVEAATYTPGGVISYDPTFFPKWESAISSYVERHPMPMLVGEWGIAHPDATGMDQFVRDSLATLDRSTSGWTVFNWCMGSGYCPIDASGADRPGIGQIFHPYARAVAGAPTATTWDPASRVLKVSFRDSAARGATEIFVQAERAYPEGWEVETSDRRGTWSSRYDRRAGVVQVTTRDTGGDHTICVKPKGAPRACP